MVKFKKWQECRVVFMLQENVIKSLRIGALCHREIMYDLPHNKVFFIGVSQHRLLLGPYVCHEQKHTSQPIMMRRNPPNLEIVYCDYLTFFGQLDPCLKYTRAVSWNYISEHTGLPAEWWENIRWHEIPQDLVTKMAEILLFANRNPSWEHAVPFENLVPPCTDKDLREDIEFTEIARYGASMEPVFLTPEEEEAFYMNEDNYYF